MEASNSAKVVASGSTPPYDSARKNLIRCGGEQLYKSCGKWFDSTLRLRAMLV